MYQKGEISDQTIRKISEKRPHDKDINALIGQISRLLLVKKDLRVFDDLDPEDKAREARNYIATANMAFSVARLDPKREENSI